MSATTTLADVVIQTRLGLGTVSYESARICGALCTSHADLCGIKRRGEWELVEERNALVVRFGSAFILHRLD